MSRILLVEDDLDVRMLLEHVLVDAGYDVTATETVKNALSLLERLPFDLVLTDGSLGDGTGIEIASEATRHNMRVLIITGYALHLPREQLTRFDYLLKPLRPAELISAIERKLAESESLGEVVPFPKSS